ncbi:LPS-assembly protein LptD [Alteromonas oceanisediminis]|uniref:LPS-assembly protein LptD n=1 Tax=Alteromonas oceanisediminis TaxID=2836180 RepID=UPI001BD92DE5|nr:LPS assembly protein LptD [Alteromonas oceanisediminis]MBT0585225.1 LPS assembly protein LptD [Alteromonas oceanisediminis]
MYKSSAFLVALLPAAAAAQDPLDFCAVQPISFDSDQLTKNGEVIVRSVNAVVAENQSAMFDGDVDITTERAVISAAKARIENNGRTVYAEGDVTFQNPEIKVNSESVDLDSTTQKLNLVDTQYQLTGFVGHGAADNISVDAQSGVVLQDVSFTTCPLGDEDWQIRASEISIEKGSNRGEARNTRFYLGEVPVFYLPYFAFPVSNQRQTGLLFPNITSSSATGVDIEQPFYWNIAPNYDLTLSPRLMTERGIQLKSEFRYLQKTGYGSVNVEYLPSDDDLASDDDDRYFYRVFHQGQLSQNWQLNIDFNGLSDDNYIVDLGSDFYNRADTHLYRTLGVSYYTPSLDFTAQLRDFEIIGDHPDTYRALPETKLEYRADLTQYLNLRVNSELAYFDNTSETAPTALRWHVAPTLALPYQRQWGELLAEASILNTYYQQDNVENTSLSEEVNRTLGQLRLYGNVVFEREQQWAGQRSTLTFEPQFQYLYTSFEQQTDIGMYDTTLLLNDVDGLFRGQEFTGLDRISDNNQITLGVTSRLLDASNREQFVFSVGQIFYLSDNKVIAAAKDRDSSAVAAELDWRISDHWIAHTDVQVTTESDRVERSSVALEYRHDEDSLVQLSHRFVRNLSGEQIDQIGLSASWPIAENWHWVGRYYRDLNLSRSIESYFGLQYESCCWAVRVVAQRHLSNRFDRSGSQRIDEFDSGVSLQFIFKGIGGQKSSRSMLEDGMFGYRQPYVLN